MDAFDKFRKYLNENMGRTVAMGLVVGIVAAAAPILLFPAAIIGGAIWRDHNEHKG